MYEFMQYLVEDVMTSEVATTTPDTTLAEVEKIFDEHDFNGLPVLDETGQLIGLMTKLDLLKAFQFDDHHMFPPYGEIMQRSVSSVMTREPQTVTLRAPLTRVLEKLVASGNKSFPVLDGDDLVGIVSREDILAALRRASEEKRPEKLSP